MPKNCLIHWQLLYTHWCQQAYHRWYMLNKISNLMLVVKLEFSICCPCELIFFQIIKTSIWIARHGQEHRCRHIRIKSLKTNLFLNSLFHPEAYIVFLHVAITDVNKSALFKDNVYWIVAHVLSWSFGKPELLTQCYDIGKVIPGLLGPLNPARNSTYTFLQELYKEILNLFQDQLVHIGGDEVPFECWYFILVFLLI